MTIVDENLTRLTHLVQSYPDAIATVLDAVGDQTVPPAARTLLVGALNYVLDLLDMFPDQYKGIGVVDDAILLRMAAQQAVAAGAASPLLKALAEQVADLLPLVGDLMAPLEKYVTQLIERSVRGRTATQIVADKDLTVMFVSDVHRHLAQLRQKAPDAIDMSVGVDWLVGEMRRMIRHELSRAKIV